MGISVDSHFAATGIPAEALEMPDVLLPERPIWALLDGFRQVEGLEDVGFRIGASHRVTDVPGLSGPLAGHVTLLETMRAFCTLLRSHANTWNYWIEPLEDGVRLCRRPTAVNIGEWPMEQYAVSYLVDLVRMAAPSSWWPRKIWLQGDLVPTQCESMWLQESEILMDSPETAILVPTYLLGSRVEEPPSPHGLEFGNQTIEDDLVANLRHMLRSYIPDSQVRLRDVAERIGVHPRSLQRRLTEVGTSFQKTLDEARFELARERLEEGQEPIADIAGALGYRGQAAFTKAFHRWAGMSPSEYRSSLITCP